jgi:hypothetical protein
MGNGSGATSPIAGTVSVKVEGGRRSRAVTP